MKTSKSSNMKNSFSLLEIILTIIISSIVIVYSMLFIKESYFENENSRSIEIHKLELLNTKAYLQKQKDIYKKLTYKNKILYFEDAVLLKKVEEFKIENKSTYIFIAINLNDKIIQEWKILK